jgi:hypothetical protein
MQMNPQIGWATGGKINLTLGFRKRLDHLVGSRLGFVNFRAWLGLKNHVIPSSGGHGLLLYPLKFSSRTCVDFARFCFL